MPFPVAVLLCLGTAARCEHTGLHQRLANSLDPIGVRRRHTQIEAEETQSTQPVSDQILGPRVSNIVLGASTRTLSIATGS